MPSTGRGHQWLLVAGFLLTIFAVPVTQAVLEHREGEPIQALDLFRDVPDKRNLRLYEDRLESQSYFVEWLRPWMQYWRFVALRDAGSKALLGRDDWWFYRPGVQYLMEREPQGLAEHVGHDAAVRAILDFREQLHRRGIRLLVVPVPGKASVVPDRLTARAANDPASVRTHTQRLIRDLAEAGVDVVDVWPTLADRRTRGGSAAPDTPPIYLPRDTHWSNEGARLAARVVADHILGEKLVAAGSVEYKTESVVAERRGDVPRMLQTPRIADLYEPHDVPCRRVMHPETREPYEDDPNAPVLVLGDSFLRIYERDEPGSAGFIAHLARFLERPVLSIVNDGGASTLVRQQLARTPELLTGKKLVVWEFVERDVRFGMEGWKPVSLPEP